MVCFEIVGRPELLACSPFKREGFVGLLHICRLSLILSAADEKKQSQQACVAFLHSVNHDSRVAR
jgi:hypothetical protein